MQLAEIRLKSLFERGLDGDRAAYHEFLTQMSVLLRAYVRRQLSRVGRVEHDAEDIVQEALLAIHAKRHAYDRDVPVTAWAHALARYKLIDLLRATANATQTLPIDQIEDFSSGNAEQLDVLLTVKTVLANLPEKMRRPIELMKLEGRSVVETAAIIGASQGAVKVNVHRGLKIIAGHLGRRRR